MTSALRDIFKDPKDLWAFLFDNVRDAAFIADAETGIILDVNAQAEQLLKRPRSEICGMHQSKLHPPEKAAKYREYFEQDHKDVQPVPKVGYVITSSGKKIPVEILANIYHLNGKTFQLGLFRNISSRRRAEKALQESETKYRTLFENTNVGIAITNKAGNFIEVNSAASNLLGYDFADITKIQSSDIYADPADREKLIGLLEKQPQLLNYEVRFKKKNGVQFWVILNARIIRYKGKIAFLTTIIDIDEKMRAREALKEAYEDALEISQLKTNLISFVSHELKTPLVPIAGWADVILTALDKGKKIDTIIGKGEIASILNSAKRLERIIDEYLDLGRLEGKKLVLNKKPLHLVKLLAEAVKNVEMLARASNITIHVNVEDVTLDVDGFRIEQVFINILSNAIKYSPLNKEVWISSQKEESFLKVLFVDQGCGFTEEELRGIWRPFVNLASRHKKGMPTGTGIGLYLTKGLVEIHGGTIEIFSPGVDKGSRVEISLPLKAQTEKEFVVKESLVKN